MAPIVPNDGTESIIDIRLELDDEIDDVLAFPDHADPNNAALHSERNGKLFPYDPGQSSPRSYARLSEIRYLSPQR